MELSDMSFGGTRVPWNSMECSMEFHGTKWYVIWRHQSSIEFHGMFHGIPWNKVICHLAAPEFHGIPWNIPWNSMEHLCHLLWCPPNSMESHGTRWFFVWRLQSSMEFHGISRGSPARVKCHKTAIYLKVPWNSMELSDTSFGDTKVPWNSMEYSMEFHGTTWYFTWRHQCSLEFQGLFHGIPWNTCVICNGTLLIPWNPMEFGDFLFGDSRVPWNSMEYPVEFQPG